MLKSLIALAVFALITVDAGSAFAQVRGSVDGDTVYETKLPNFPHAKSARDAYSAEHPASMKSDDVYAPNGVYQGSDPDPNVRLELRRDECRWGC